MSQANTQSNDSSDAQPGNSGSDSDIVITNSPDSEEATEPEVEDDTEAESEEVEPEVEEEPESDPEGVDEPEVEEEEEVDVDDEESSEEDASDDTGSQTESNSGVEAEGEESENEDMGSGEPDQEADSSDDSMDVAEVNHPPRELEATIEASSLATALDSISVLVEECKLRTTPEGINIRAVDPANVGMADLSLQAETFESFNTTNGVLGVDLERLEDVIGLADNGDLVTLELDTETRKLHIYIDGIEYTLALIDPDSIRQEPDIPDLDLPCEVVAESDQIARAVKAADMVSDHIEFRSNEDGRTRQLIIEAEGDTDDVELVLDEEELVSYPQFGPAHSIFSLDYVKDFKKALPNNAEVALRMGEEFPLKMNFTSLEENMEVNYMLAPRIQSD